MTLDKSKTSFDIVVDGIRTIENHILVNKTNKSNLDNEIKDLVDAEQKVSDYESYLKLISNDGISLDILSCLILGTPVNNEPLLTQLIGRIIRNYDGKQQPTVVDVHLIGNTAKRQANARLGYYLKQGYEVSTL